MGTRAGQAARELVRQDVWNRVRRGWWQPFAVTGGVVALCLAALVVFNPRQPQAFALGVTAASAVWLVTMAVRDVTGAGSRMMGAEAEVWTAAELRKLGKAGWLMTHHLPIESTDADHVAIGPEGVYVIETKWSHDWSGPWADRCIRRAVDAARAGAKRCYHVVKRTGVARVDPVVVLWGPPPPDLPREVDGVTVLHGADLVAHLAASRPSGGELIAQERKAAHDALLAYLEMRDVDERVRRPLPPIVTDGPLRLGAQLLTGVSAAILAWLAITVAGTHHGMLGLTAAIVAVGSAATVVGRFAARHDLFRVGALGSAVATAGLTVMLLVLLLQAWWIA